MGNNLYPDWLNKMAETKKGTAVRTAKAFLNSDALSDAQRLSVLLSLGGTQEQFVTHATQVRGLLKGVIAPEADVDEVIAGFKAEMAATAQTPDTPAPQGPRETAAPKGEVAPKPHRQTAE